MRNILIPVLALFVLGILLKSPQPSYAQTPKAISSSNEPLEITADATLEWRRNEKRFIATKNAIARQGVTSIAATTLTADYRESKASSIDIWQMTAIKNVVIRSKDNAVYGDKAVYNLDEGKAVITGNNLRMIAPDQLLTAQERFEYWTVKGELIAIGRAKIKYLEDTLEADKIIAILKDNAQGKRVLYSLEAIGNVIITTPTETLTGAQGFYQADTNKANISGGVTIKRGPNILKGERADIDLNTNTSRLHGSTNGNGRVYGVFYPGSEKKVK